MLFSNFSGGPFVLDLTGFGNIGDAESRHNILSGTEPGSGSEETVCFTCFIEVTFDTDEWKSRSLTLGKLFCYFLWMDIPRRVSGQRRRI